MEDINHNSIEILVIEDNAGDARLIKECLIEGKLLHSLTIVTDGVEAMEFLNKKGQYKAAPRPSLILLDLNLPRKDGREVLTEIKNDEKLKIIPVIVLTTSQAEEDIFKSYNLHANCYITKPISFNEFIRVVKTLEDFWFTIVKLPS